MFFNAPYFKQQAQTAIDAAGPDLKWFVLDALPVTQVDVTGYFALDDLAQTLRTKGVQLMLAGRTTESNQRREAAGIAESPIFARFFPTLAQAVESFRSSTTPP